MGAVGSKWEEEYERVGGFERGKGEVGSKWEEEDERV